MNTSAAGGQHFVDADKLVGIISVDPTICSKHAEDFPQFVDAF